MRRAQHTAALRAPGDPWHPPTCHTAPSLRCRAQQWTSAPARRPKRQNRAPRARAWWRRRPAAPRRALRCQGRSAASAARQGGCGGGAGGGSAGAGSVLVAAVGAARGTAAPPVAVEGPSGAYSGARRRQRWHRRGPSAPAHLLGALEALEVGAGSHRRPNGGLQSLSNVRAACREGARRNSYERPRRRANTPVLRWPLTGSGVPSARTPPELIATLACMDALQEYGSSGEESDDGSLNGRCAAQTAAGDARWVRGVTSQSSRTAASPPQAGTPTRRRSRRRSSRLQGRRRACHRPPGTAAAASRCRAAGRLLLTAACAPAAGAGAGGAAPGAHPQLPARCGPLCHARLHQRSGGPWQLPAHIAWCGCIRRGLTASLGMVPGRWAPVTPPPAAASCVLQCPRRRTAWQRWSSCCACSRPACPSCSPRCMRQQARRDQAALRRRQRGSPCSLAAAAAGRSRQQAAPWPSLSITSACPAPCPCCATKSSRWWRTCASALGGRQPAADPACAGCTRRAATPPGSRAATPG